MTIPGSGLAGINKALRERSYRRGYAAGAKQAVDALLKSRLIPKPAKHPLAAWLARLDDWATAASVVNTHGPMPPLPAQLWLYRRRQNQQQPLSQADAESSLSS